MSEILLAYEKALRFYARHEHWMAQTDADDLRRELVAMAGHGRQDGWRVAENVLAEFNPPVTQTAPWLAGAADLDGGA